ncbi:hypothetical protein Q1695_014415 [Nippostrongylus brasiliensis]|nr:hypothetical protein Q1695_014415 [Nippostrongylus brasiliensis]
MPGIFSWKNRILGRKTPEPERAKQVTLTRESVNVDRDLHNHTPRRSVRFNEDQNEFAQYNVPDWQNDYGEARVIGSVTATNGMNGLEKCDQTQAAGDWRYADSPYRVAAVAPLASSEVVDEETNPRRFQPTPSANSSRAGSVLQHLREQGDQMEFMEPRRPSSTLPPMSCRPMTPVRGPPQLPPPQYGSSPVMAPRWDSGRNEQPQFASAGPNGSDFMSGARQLDQMNVVFLQANDEVKRAILPPEVHSLDQVKMAFVRAFPNISRHYIEQPSIKIYIQEPSKGQLFYELDDPSDIRNKSVLKLREHPMTGMQSPVRFLDQPDYLSETENDDGRQRFMSLARPASAMAHSDYRKNSRKNFETYDTYGSDTSSHDSRSVTRSGSATPVIDRESRARMESMERQLAGLSSLVHSALVSKGMSESSRRDMADLRREILALHPDAERAASEEPPSIPDSFSSHTQHQLDHLRQKLQQAGTDMKQLRRIAQVNAQNARKYISEAAEEITRLVSQKLVVPVAGLDVNAVETSSEQRDDGVRERKMHEDRLIRLLEGLTRFENNVENVRSSVLTSNRKLRMSEVESLTEGLTEIGREAAALKTQFPSIQAGIESRIKADMERIVREEKYIRDQTSAVDQSLRRCKALANIMVTMKKLAMVQDPTIQRSKKEPSSPSSIAPSPTLGAPPPAPPPPPPPKPDNPTTNSMMAAGLSNSHDMANTAAAAQQMTNGYHQNHQNNGHEIAATYTPNISRNAPELLPPIQHNSSQSSPAAELDQVLEEVAPAGIPPRPPSRFSVQDVRVKFQKPPELPDQLRNMMEDAARRGSPAPEPTDRRLDLEERQERLAEKQRQLLSQFQQLQQMTPLP